MLTAQQRSHDSAALQMMRSHVLGNAVDQQRLPNNFFTRRSTGSTQLLNRSLIHCA
jgi:hypothetical protein